MFKKITINIVKYFWIIFLFAIILGLVFPNNLSRSYNLLTPFIILLMYLGGLDVDYSQLYQIKNNYKQIAIYYIVMMIIIPIVLYYSLLPLSGNFATGVFLLAIAPAGIAAVSFTRLMKGNSLMALILAIITTISTPILLPIMSKYILGNNINIDGFSMFMDLILFCILPIIASYLTKKYLSEKLVYIYPHIDWVSILLIGFMILGPVSYNANLFLSVDFSKLIIIVLGLFGISFIIHIFGRFCFSFGKNKLEDKIAGSLAKGFMNISVITVIAAKYFGPEVLLVVMLYEFPRDLMLIPFGKFIKYQVDNDK